MLCRHVAVALMAAVTLLLLSVMAGFRTGASPGNRGAVQDNILVTREKP